MKTIWTTTSKEICPATTGEVCLHKYTGHIFDVQTQIERIPYNLYTSPALRPFPVATVGLQFYNWYPTVTSESHPSKLPRELECSPHPCKSRKERQCPQWSPWKKPKVFCWRDLGNGKLGVEIQLEQNSSVLSKRKANKGCNWATIHVR